VSNRARTLVRGLVPEPGTPTAVVGEGHALPMVGVVRTRTILASKARPTTNQNTAPPPKCSPHTLSSSKENP
jgi:hypothetical protein